MKKTYLFSLMVVAGLLAGCGQKADSTSAAAPAAAPAAPAAPAVANLEITANDTMKFNLTRLEVKAGQEVKLVFTNMGTLPKAAMGHNWVLLAKGADPKAFVDASVAAAATDYVPASQAAQVVAHTKMLGPKQSDEISFKAPSEPGEYVYLCSFPGHFLTGMKGVLVVQ